MASKKGTNTETASHEQDGTLPLSYGDKFTVEDARALPLVSLKHLLSLGFSTAIKNSIAGLKAGLKGESKTEDNNWSEDDIRAFLTEKSLVADVDLLSDEELRSDAIVALIADAYQSEMFDAILSGTVGQGGRGARGPRLSPDQRLLREVAIWYLENLVAKLGKAMPKNTVSAQKDEAGNEVKGSDGKVIKVRDNKLDAAIQKVLENPKHREAIDAEFARRKAATSGFDAGESTEFLDDLLG